MSIRTHGRALTVAPALISVLLVAGLWASQTHAQVPMQGVSGTDGVVRALALTDTHLYIGGGFTLVGPSCGAWTSFDLATGVPLPGGAKVAGTVLAAIPDGSGGWYLGGRITGAGGLPRSSLAHLTAGGGVDAWAPVTDGSVSALAKHGNVVFVSGDFHTVNGVARTNLAAVDAVTGSLLPWNVGANNSVYALALAGDTLFAGGTYSELGGITRTALAALDANTGAVLPWNITLTGSPFANPTPQVSRIVKDGGRLYVCGDFVTAGGQATGAFAAIDIATATPVPGSYQSPFGIYDMIVHGGRIYMAGLFAINGSHGVMALSRSTLQLANWYPPVPDSHSAGTSIVAAGDHVIVGVGQTDFNAAPPAPLRAIDTLSATVLPFSPPLVTSGWPVVLRIDGGRLWAGGGFGFTGGQAHPALAELDLLTGQVTSRTFPFPGSAFVSAIATDGGRLFAYNIDNRIYAFDLAAGGDPIWSTPASYVSRLFVHAGRLFVAGGFSTVAGLVRHGLCELDPATGLPTAWSPTLENPGDSPSASALTADDDRLYAGGHFMSVDGSPRTCLASFRLPDLTLESQAYDPILDVNGLAVSGDRLFAQGTATASNGGAYSYLAAFDRDTGADTHWLPFGFTSAQLDIAQPTDLVVSNGDLLVANQHTVTSGFTHAHHSPVRISLATNTWSPYAFEPNDNAATYALAGRDGVLAIGGSFQYLGAFPGVNLAIVKWPSTAVPTSVHPSAGGIQLRPDPVRDRLTLSLGPAVGSARAMDIFDVAGRRVRTFRNLPQAAAELVWDLRRDDGALTAPGVHFAVLRDGSGRRTTARFVVVR